MNFGDSARNNRRSGRRVRWVSRGFGGQSTGGETREARAKGQKLIQAGSVRRTGEHVGHPGGTRGVPVADRLVEFPDIDERRLKVPDAGHVPLADGPVEHARALEHGLHRRHLGHVPSADVSVKREVPVEHPGHVGDAGRIPPADVHLVARHVHEELVHVRHLGDVPVRRIGAPRVPAPGPRRYVCVKGVVGAVRVARARVGAVQQLRRVQRVYRGLQAARRIFIGRKRSSERRGRERAQQKARGFQLLHSHGDGNAPRSRRFRRSATGTSATAPD